MGVGGGGVGARISNNADDLMNGMGCATLS